MVDAQDSAGIYVIEFATGEVYVGSSVNVGRRWQEHERDLRAGRHRNRRLQAAWAASGGGASFVMIEHLPGASVNALARHEAWVVGRLVTEGRSVLNAVAPRRLAQRLVLSPRASSAAPTRRIGPSLAQRHRQEREQLILRAAGELMLEKGYHETSFSDIAARVGISKGTVYLHFTSKEDLAFALYVKGMRSLLQDLDAMAASPVSPRRKLRAIIERVHRGMSSEHAQLLTMLSRSPEFQARFIVKRQELEVLREGPRKRITAIVEEGKAACQIDRELPTPLVVSLVWGMLSPYAHRGLIVEKRTGSNLVVAHLCRFFLKGIAPGDVPPDNPADSPSNTPPVGAADPETEPLIQDDEETSALTANGVMRQ